MSIIEITRGFQFKYQIPNQYTVLVFKCDTEKIVLNTVLKSEGKNYLYASAQVTKKYRPNQYKYQLIDNEKILAEGEAIIKQNFLFADQNESVKSRNEIILQAIEATLGGIATQAQSSIAVGDKNISYMSFDELLKAREFFKKKVAEQKKGYVAGNESRIKYRWGF